MLDFYKKSAKIAPMGGDDEARCKAFRRMQWSSFVAVTLGYSMYYVCRTSLNVVKKPILDSGSFSASELGVISSALLFTYAIGKLVNGFLADHSNVKRFMATGLLLSTVANIVVGVLGFLSAGQVAGTMTALYIIFAVMWGVNGWAQSMGAPASVVTLSRWYTDKNRGSFYGFWSMSHNLGEFFSYLFVGGVVGLLGWQYGFLGASVAGLLGVVLVVFCLHDSPESNGLPSVMAEQMSSDGDKSIGKQQLQVLRNPYVWLLAAASAFMYVSRYAVNGWGVLFLQEEKGFSLELATQIISINALLGIIGTVCSGWISDRIFRGNRYFPTVISGVLEVVGLLLFAFGGNSVWVNVTAMVCFGIAIGVLMCFLGGLMAVDLVSRKASGAALGVVGVASYAAAGVQDIASGLLIDRFKEPMAGNDAFTYNFTPALVFWIGAAVLSCLIVVYVWVRKNGKLKMKN